MSHQSNCRVTEALLESHKTLERVDYAVTSFKRAHQDFEDILQSRITRIEKWKKQEKTARLGLQNTLANVYREATVLNRGNDTWRDIRVKFLEKTTEDELKALRKREIRERLKKEERMRRKNEERERREKVDKVVDELPMETELETKHEVTNDEDDDVEIPAVLPEGWVEQKPKYGEVAYFVQLSTGVICWDPPNGTTKEGLLAFESSGSVHGQRKIRSRWSTLRSSQVNEMHKTVKRRAFGGVNKTQAIRAALLGFSH